MANNPSSNSRVIRSHVRKPTPVVPALPLSLSDKTWRRPSEVPHSILAEVAQQSATTSRTSQYPASDSRIHPSDASKPALVNGTNTPSSQFDEPGQEAGEQWDNQHAEVTTVEIQRREAHVEVGPADLASSFPPSQQDLPTSNENGIERLCHVPVERETEAEITRQTTRYPATSEDTKDTQAFDNDRQSSEQDVNSVEPSSMTAEVENSSHTGESTLETVVGDVHHPQPGTSFSHRQSGAAPEVLRNGLSPHSAQGSHSSQPINPPHSLARPKPTLLPSIGEHLLLIATSKQFFDTVIYVNHPDPALQPSEHLTHSLVLGRSEVFGKIISDFDPAIHPKVINLFPCRNIFSHAFEAALRFLYSDQILNIHTLSPPDSYHEKAAQDYSFEYVMSYWISGVELGLQAVKTRAYEMVQELLNSEVADTVAREVQHLRFAAQNMKNAHDKHEIHEIANSLSYLLAHRFFAKLDLGVVDLSETSPLPRGLVKLFAALELAAFEYPSSKNPALSAMVFGSLPTNHDVAPSTTSIAIAVAILLNFEFVDFGIIAEELMATHGLPAERLMKRAIDLREAKRQEAVNDRAIPNKARLDNALLWEAAGWKEYLNAEGRLARERVGFLLPNNVR